MTKVCYQPDLAWVHHAGYSQHATRTAAGIIGRLRAAGLPRGARVLDVGCGSGELARSLVAAGFSVCGVDASPAMIELARRHVPDARFEVLALPTGAPEALPQADAVVSTGHVLNYLPSPEAIAQALSEMARAVRHGGALAVDFITERFAQQRAADPLHAKVEEDWAIVVRFSRPLPRRFDREITVFRRANGDWRRSDEHHRNVTFEAEEARRVLFEQGIDAEVRSAFGEETLPEGMVVLTGTRR